MSGINGFSSTLLRLAHWLAGPDRRDWIMAMASETDAAGCQGTVWAVGCLWAAVRDRVTHEYWFLAALVALPSVSLILTFLSVIPLYLGARAIGVRDIALAPFLLLGQLPAAWLLGRMRPHYSAIGIGSLSFVVQQFIPLAAMRAITGTWPPFWAPNMFAFNLPSSLGLALSWTVWVVATRWGGAPRRIQSRN